MSATADDAVVQMVASLLTTYLQAELTIVFAAAGLGAPIVGSVVSDTTTPAQRAHSVQVWMRQSRKEEGQAVNVSAPIRRAGEVVIQANAASADPSVLSRTRTLWAHAIERVIEERWRLQTSVHLTSLDTRVEHERSTLRDNQGLVGVNSAVRGASPQVVVDPVQIIVSYRQRADQTTRVV